MKRILLFLTLFIFQYPYLFCQNSNDSTLINPKKISYYRVKEIINSRFGGSTTIYTVSSLDLIKKTDLGPGNQRIITPVYKVEKSPSKNRIVKIPKVNLQRTDSSNSNLRERLKKESNDLNTKINSLTLNEKDSNHTISKGENTKTDNNTEKKYVYVNVIKTYEAVANKGYKSVKMFKEIGDSYYFKKDFNKAEIWYDKLFSMKPELEPKYYYRYADTLIKIGKLKQGNKLMQKYYSLNTSS